MGNNDKLHFLEELFREINSTRSPQEMLNFILDRIIEITGALTGSIMLITPGTKILEIKAFRGLQSEKAVSVRLKIGEGVTGKVAETGRPLLIPNVDAVAFYVRIREDLKSELAVPLRLENRIIGVINVDSDKIAAFTDEHMDMLCTVSDFVVQILYKENLIKNLESQVEKQALLLQIAEILEEDLPLDDIFKKIMHALSEKIAIERGMLVLLDSDDKLKVFDGYRLSEQAKERGVYQIGEGIIGQVYKNGKGIHIDDISKNKEFLNRMKIRRGRAVISFFAVPIRYENKTVGVLSYERKYHSPGDTQDVYELAKLISTMISNRVHLYVRAEREKAELLKTNIQLKDKLIEKDSNIVFIGKDKAIQEILAMVDVVADTEASLLVTGETGTGKEMIAALLHYKSLRWDKPFISLNCAAIPPALLESELFGYKRGAFTGADRDHKGKFLQADKGTIFLDEIGDLDFNLQAKILRVLQDKIIEPVGAEKGIKVDVRIIVATNKDLKKLAAEGRFREDLLYRINVINIHLPSLRRRRDDIPLLVDFFLKFYNKKYKKNILAITSRFMEILVNHDWPGNIRELQNVMERAVILAKTQSLDTTELPDELRAAVPEDTEDALGNTLIKEIGKYKSGKIYEKVIGRVENILLEYALVKSDNRQTDAAALLGIHRNTLYQKMQNRKKSDK